MDIREEIIRKGLNKWASNSYAGILQYGTGSGKTFAGILASEHFINKYPDERILIVCPTYAVIENFQAEFKKFKKLKLLKYCDFICYHSIADIVSTYSLVVLDEIHNVTSENRMTFFDTRKYRAILGLSASITEKQEQLLNPYLTIVDSLVVSEARDLDLVSEFTIFTINVDLTDEEKDLYDKATSIIDYTYIAFGRQSWKQINTRKKLIYRSSNKLKLIGKLSDLFKGEYGIIFSLTKVEADEVSDLLGESCVSIHSNMSIKKRQILLNKFKDGRTKVKLISTAKIFDEGVTLPRLAYGVIGSGSSKEKQSIQRLGRLIRKDTNKHAILIRIVVKNTVEEKWVKESFANFNVINVNSYEELREKINQIKSTIS